ncbi:MAG TPA: HAD-IIA family hydrolase [Thermomicrobiales bacterium]|nr:HAD-IIA family hydrolase [Thermomicrobiales bacterium]
MTTQSTADPASVSAAGDAPVTPGTAGAHDRAVQRLRAARGFVLDMDGVLYRGNTLLPGVADFLNALDLRGIPYMLATNNSTATAVQYVAKLAALGITVDAEHILTSGMATRDYLLKALPAGAGIYVVGAPALREQLFDGTPFHPVQYGEETPTAVVVGLDVDFTYAKLKAANAAIRAGAVFIATNADLTLPTEEGLVPGSGSIIAAVAAASGTQPTVIGKPEPVSLLQALDVMNVPPDRAVMIGDRLETDILAGQRAGMLTAMVLTGVSTRDDLPGAPALPDLIFNDLPALTEALAASDR